MKKKVLAILAILVILICVNISQTQTILKNLGSVVMQKFYEEESIIIDNDSEVVKGMSIRQMKKNLKIII